MITAHDIANAYVDAVSAYWRGDNDGDLRRLSAWIERFWTVHLYEPSNHPAAVSPHAAGGHGIHWYEAGSTIVGCVPGRQGCYRIPRASTLFTEMGSGRKSTSLSQEWAPTSGPSVVLSRSLREPALGIRR